MKKLVLTIAVITFLFSAAFAAPTKLNERTLSTFAKEFKDAQNISWKTSEDYTLATFTWKGQKLQAFYDNTGTRKALVRNIEIENLPMGAQFKLNEKYADYTLDEIMEVNTSDDGMYYYACMKKPNRTLVLKISSTGDQVSVQKKIKHSTP